MSAKQDAAPGRDLEKQVEAYKKERALYVAFAEILEAQLRSDLDRLGIDAIVSARAKSIPSFAEKAIRKAGDYDNPLDQFPDLCGARVIASSQEEIEQICTCIRRRFHVELETSSDNPEQLEAQEFGYRAIHYTVSLRKPDSEQAIRRVADRKLELGGKDARQAFQDKADRLLSTTRLTQRPGFPEAEGPRYRAEIQVRTLLQHAWAHIERGRMYKVRFTAPAVLRREMHRVSAVLEESDQAFSRIVLEWKEYQTHASAYLPPEERAEELQLLSTIRQHDPENVRLALDLARLAMSAGECDLARETLGVFVEAWEGELEASGPGQKSASDRLIAALRTTWESCRDQSDDDREADERRLRARQLLDTNRDPVNAAVLLLYGRALLAIWRKNPTDSKLLSEARRCLELSIAVDRGNVEAVTAMASSHEVEFLDRPTPGLGAATEAQRWFRRASALDGAHPGALAGALRHTLSQDGRLNAVHAYGPHIRMALDRARGLARMKLCLPQAYFDIGFFHLLLEEPYESLNAYARAVTLVTSEREIEEHLGWMKILCERIESMSGRPWEQGRWVADMLMAAVVAKLWSLERAAGSESQSTIAGRRKKAEEDLACLRCVKPGEWNWDDPILIVAGGCDDSVTRHMKQFEAMITRAMDNFDGTVIGGGTKAGISGLVGEARRKHASSVRALAYAPDLLPRGVEEHPAYDIKTAGKVGLSARQPIQYWVDMLAAGVDPSTVRLLGINGGRISALEYRLALAFGAEVGVIQGSGRSADSLIRDPDWFSQDEVNPLHASKETLRLLLLPSDIPTVQVFVEGVPSLTFSQEDPSVYESMAQDVHEEHRIDKRERLSADEPELAGWEDLREDLKRSNLEQINDFEAKLYPLGYRIAIASEYDGPKVDEFTDEMHAEHIKTMAIREHARWNVERLRSRWLYAPYKDSEHRLSHCIVPYSEVPPEYSIWDVKAAKDIPKLLRKYGFVIVPPHSK